MRLSSKGIALATAAVALLFTIDAARADSGYMSDFRSAYPGAVGTRIDSCSMCHTSGSTRNPYGAAWRSANYNFVSIEGADSDGDGFSNGEEIAARFFPGNAADHPVATGDTTAPTIDVFNLPTTADSLTVSVTLSASDDTGVTGFLLKETPGTPAAGAAGWSAPAPATFTFPAAGLRTLYAWAKDAAGNVSNSATDSVTITLPPPPDTTAPTIDVFNLPTTADSLTVSVTLSASDDTGVTGFLLKETPGTPTAGAAGWTASAPATYTFPAEGIRTLYAWARDAAGNVSNGASDSVTITLPPPADTTAPTIDAFDLPTTADSLTVSVILSASDDTGVTGFLLKETPGTPAAGAAGWTASAPATYTFPAEGIRTLYAWARDAAGNVSNGASDSVTITLPPPAGEPIFSDDFSDAENAGDPDWETVRGKFGGIRKSFVPLGRRRNLALVAQAAPELDPLPGGRIEARVRFKGASRRSVAEIVFDYQDPTHYRFARLDWGMKRLLVGQVGDFGGGSDGEVLSLQRRKLFRSLTKWHRFRIDLDPVAGTAAVFVDGAADPVLTKSFPLVGIGRVGLAAQQAPGKVAFDNFKVWGTDVLP